MATSTLLQRLDRRSNATGGGPSDTVGSSPATSHRRQIEQFEAFGTITAGQWVCFVSDEATILNEDRMLVVTAHDGAAPELNLVVGVCLDNTADLPQGQKSVRVVVSGYAEDAVCGAGVVAGDLLVATLAGSVDTATAATELKVGVALEAVAGGTCDVLVIKNF